MTLGVTANHSAAQDINPSKRGKILCPEISTLAEAVTLARDNNMPEQDALEIIHTTIKLEQNEYLVINEMVNYIYKNTEKPIYENTMFILFECYKNI